MAELDIRIGKIAARQHGTFSVHQVSGLTKHVVHHRTHAGRWRHVGRGVIVLEGTAATWEQSIWIRLHLAGSGAVVGRRSAARLHGLPGCTADHIDLVQPERSAPQRKPNSSRRTSTLPRKHLTIIHGFPTTTAERTLFDLAGLTSSTRRRRGWVHLPEARVERLVDDALLRKLVTVQSLTSTFFDLAGHGRPGTQLMRRLLLDRTDGFVATESELEDLFVRFLDRNDLPQARRQVSLGSNDHLIGRVDFVYDRAKLAIELDGWRFHSQQAAVRADKRRDLELLAAGWHSIRIDWWQLVNEGPRLAALLRSVLERA